MAERNRSSRDISMASPLYSPGVERVEVDSPIFGSEVPDPMGYMSSDGVTASHKTAGRGDGVNDWSETAPEE